MCYQRFIVENIWIDAVALIIYLYKSKFMSAQKSVQNGGNMENRVSEAKTACAYIRVSTDKQDELSPDAQKRLLLEYANRNNILIQNESIFMEHAISGKRANKRPAFMKMIGLAKSKEHPFDVILVWKFSRFARNQEESIVYKSLLKKNNVEVLSISEPLIDGPFGSLIERIIEWMDEYYSIRLSGEVIRGMTEKALRGGYQSNPPLGYRLNKETKIAYVIEDEAEIVRRIYNEYAYRGKSFLEIARDINILGYKTGRGKPFEQRTIRYILENPFYVGKVRWNRQNHNTHTIKDKSEWIIADAPHKRIIDEALFNLVQEQIKGRTRPYKSRTTSSINHWLVGIVRCSACDHTLLACAKGTKDGTFYYQCGSYNKGSCHVSHAIKSTTLEENIIDAFEKVLNTGDFKCEIKQNNNSNNSNNNSGGSHNLTLLTLQIKKISDKEFRVKQAYRDGIDTLDEYKENKKLLQIERVQLEEQVDKETNATNLKDEVLNQIHNVYDIIRDEKCDKRIRGNALRSVVSKIVYDKPNDTLVVYFYIAK